MEIDKYKLINIDEDLDAAIILASELFHSGKVFIYPTDTIYGIGGNPFDEAEMKLKNLFGCFRILRE
jgi:tRNA A37 threonylcarbamoyladenosine synthetase subunit TsaC/SUA5/YrdC